MASDERVIKSHVFYGSRCFFVSTIERNSSAAMSSSRFFETIVWEFDWDNDKRGDLLYCNGSPRTLNYHLEVCRALYRDGNLDSLEESEGE